MITGKHTPGPWRTSAYDDSWDYCVRGEHGQIIAKLGENNPANANLIAAAPDLLMSLREFVIIGATPRRGIPIYVRARAAIAKARGEQ